jgi:hypothetical protein
MLIKIFMVFLSSFFALSGPFTESLDGTHVVVEKERRDGYFALVVRGTGMFTFVHEFGSASENYHINSLQVIGDDFVIDGYFLDQTTRIYHAYYLVISPQGEIKTHQRFMDPNHQDISGIYPLKEGYLVHLTQMDTSTELFEKEVLIIQQNAVEKEDIFFREILKIDATEQGYHVYFKYENSSELFITMEGTFITGNDVFGIENKAVVEGEVLLLFAGEAQLNHTVIEAPYKIEIPGHYTLVLNQKYTRFTLNPIVSGIQAKTVYTKPVQIQYEFGQAYLNEEPYASSQIIEKPGNYVFGFYEETYTYEIPFTLTANVKGIRHLERYQDSVYIEFLGEGYLNNQFIQSGLEITEPGLYTLKVFGASGYLETHLFEIEEDASKGVNIVWVERGLLGGSALLGLGLLVDFILHRVKKKHP